MENCLFCKIARKEIPSQTVYEDEWSLGFLDLHPISWDTPWLFLKNMLRI